MTPLEQFNEEVRRTIDIHFDNNGNFHGSYLGIGDFFLERLQTHKELILKMVREQVPAYSPIRSLEATYWNCEREKFLKKIDSL